MKKVVYNVLILEVSRACAHNSLYSEKFFIFEHCMSSLFLYHKSFHLQTNEIND